MINGKLSEKLTSVNMLARKLGLTVKQLFFIVYNLETFYTVYQIPKKTVSLEQSKLRIRC